MRLWIILTILASVPNFSRAAPHPKKTQNLEFEISVPPESELFKTLSVALEVILARQGYQLTVTSLPPKRGLQDLKAGKLDGTVGRIGNLARLLDNRDLVRVDVPIAIIQISRWCRKDLKRTEQPILLGARLGTLILTIMKEHMALSQIKFMEISDQKGIVQMVKTGRMDCLLSNENILEADGVVLKELSDLDRFDLVSFEVYPWINKKYLHLKKDLELELKNYPFPASFRKKFLDQKPACEGALNVLCADGLIVPKKVDLGVTSPRSIRFEKM